MTNEFWIIVIRIIYAYQSCKSKSIYLWVENLEGFGAYWKKNGINISVNTYR